MDSLGKKAGKGPLIQEDKSGTLGVSQDQTLFQPIGVDPGVYCLDDQGGQQISVRTDGKSPTLRAECHGNVPCVFSFEPGIARREGGHIYGDVCGTLRAKAGDNQMAVAYAIENHPNDSRVRIDESGKVQTLTSRCGTGGGNVPIVMFSKVKRAQSNEDYETWGDTGVSNTLNNFDNGDVRTNECVICMATQQGGAEIAKDLSPTITATAGMSGNNQPVICLEGHVIDRETEQNGKGWREDQCYTLNTIDRPGVAYCIGNGQVHDAQRPDKEFAKTPNCMVDPMNYAMQAICQYKESKVASALKMRDYKDATDLIVGGAVRQRL